MAVHTRGGVCTPAPVAAVEAAPVAPVAVEVPVPAIDQLIAKLEHHDAKLTGGGHELDLGSVRELKVLAHLAKAEATA